MADTIGPGSVVECVNNGPMRSRLGRMISAPQLTVGATYHVIDIGVIGGLVLAEVVVSQDIGNFDGFNPDRFRIRPPRPWIARLLTVDTDVRETVGVE